MSYVIFGFGFLLIVEGLVLALAPLRFEQLVAMLAAMTDAQRMRLGGLAALAGLALIALAWIVKA